MVKSEFARRLESILKAQDMTLADLERRTGLKYHQMHSWFRRAGAKPSAAALERVALALGVTSTFLLNGTRAPDALRPAVTELKQIVDQLTLPEVEVLLSAARTMRAQKLRG